jgi:hypothetical protein
MAVDLASAAPFRAAALGDAAAFGDHAVEDLGLHAVDVVDALEAYVAQLDAVLRHDFLGFLEDLGRQLGAPRLDVGLRLGRADSRQLLVRLKLAVGCAHELDQVVGGDDVARLPVHDVVQPALRAALVADRREVLERFGDAPARIDVDPDVLLVARRDLALVAVELQPALVETVHRPDEGNLEV